MKASLNLMFLVKADSVEIQFVDEREYQNEGKWYIRIDKSGGPPLSLKFPYHCQPQIEVAACTDV